MSNDQPFTVALTRYPHTEALISGRVRIDECPLDFLDIEGALIPTFRRMSREQAYGVCELGISTALIARDLGLPVTLLPVFVTRRFDHEAIFIHQERIKNHADLNGSTIGLRSYTVTDAVWSRAALSEACDVDLDSIKWIVTGDEHTEGSKLPAKVDYLPGDLDQMIDEGVIDVMLNPYRGKNPNVVPLFADFISSEREWYANRGYVPIHHVIVIRRDVVASCPSIGPQLFEAFSQSKLPFLQDLHARNEFSSDADNRHIYGMEYASDRFEDDPVPYGINANRLALDDLMSFAKKQHIISDKWQVEDLFIGV